MPGMLSEDDIQQIEARVQAATPGPWTIGFNGAMRSGWAIIKAGSSRTVLHLDPAKNIDLDEATHQVDADLDFVQFARSDIETLLAEVKKQQAPSTDTPETTGLQDAQLALMEIAQRCERLQQALEFYAELNHYRPPRPPPGEPAPLWIGNDLGRRAREALGLPEVSVAAESPAG